MAGGGVAFFYPILRKIHDTYTETLFSYWFDLNVREMWCGNKEEGTDHTKDNEKTLILTTEYHYVWRRE